MKSESKLSFLGATLNGIGGSLGVGVVTYLGLAIANAGKGTILTVLIALGIGLFQALPMLMLSRRIVLKGGMYTLYAEGIGPEFGALFVYYNFLALFSLHVYPLTVITYIFSVIPGAAAYSKIGAIVLILLVTLLLCNGMKSFEMAQGIFTALLSLAILLFVGFGIYYLASTHSFSFVFDDDIFQANGMTGVLTSVPLIAAVAYGFCGPFYLSAVTQKPTKNVPKAMIISAIVMWFTWIMFAIIDTNVLPIDQVAGQPLTYVAQAIMPGILPVVFVLCGPVMAVLTNYLGAMPSMSIQFAKCAQDGFLPKIFYKQNKHGIYYVIYVLAAIIGIVCLAFDVSITSIILLMALVGSISTFLWAVSYLFILKRHPDIFKSDKERKLFLVVAVLCIFANVFYFYTSVRSLSITAAVVSIAVYVGLFTLNRIRIKKGKLVLPSSELGSYVEEEE